MGRALALTEKMILDFDYLPLPEPLSEPSRKEQNEASKNRK
jgi:hypothetical protein